MGKKMKATMEEVALECMVDMLYQIREKYNLSSSGVIQFLKDRGTLHLLDDTSLLFTSICDTDDETLKILTGEDSK